MNAKILRLDKAGSPVAWLTWQECASLLVREQVVWSLGSVVKTIRGGYDRRGQRSSLDLPSIVACDGQIEKRRFAPPFSNSLLFARDQYHCLYCGSRFRAGELSRDHILPVSKGGKDSWTNCVTACRRCNNRKADRTPEQAGMELLAIPFVPNRHEYFYLANRNVLADQMEFLRARFSQNSRLQ